MASLSQPEIERTLPLILAGAKGPLTLDEIQNRFDRAGYQVNGLEILQALQTGRFRSIGKRWELVHDSA
jgi:hypothetical protein